MNRRYGFIAWSVGYEHFGWFFLDFRRALKSLAGVHAVRIIPATEWGAMHLVVLCLFNSEDDRNLLLGTEHMAPDALVAELFAEAKSRGLILSSLQLINPGSDLQLVRKLSQ